jgi:thiamine kinase-like enzyme
MKTSQVKFIVSKQNESNNSKKIFLLFSNGYIFETCPLISKKSISLLINFIRNLLVFCIKKTTSSKRIRASKISLIKVPSNVEVLSGNHINQNVIMITNTTFIKYFLCKEEFGRLDTILSTYKDLTSKIDGITIPEITHVKRESQSVMVEFKLITGDKKYLTSPEIIKIINDFDQQLSTIAFNKNLSIESFVNLYYSDITLSKLVNLMFTNISFSEEQNYTLQHGDFWKENIFNIDNDFYIVDFDNLMFLPKNYDLIYFLYTQILNENPSYLNEILSENYTICSLKEQHEIIKSVRATSMSQFDIKICENIFFLFKYLNNLKTNDNFDKKIVEDFMLERVNKVQSGKSILEKTLDVTF